ncbi:MAG: helix-turn-helix domain-containing protein [Candidatus Woesearchaeota archaeon]
MTKIQQVLENLGFSPNEIKVYLTLNDNGSCKAGRIAKLANIDRSSCYNALQSLIAKGLSSYVLIGKVKWFQATGPKSLIEYVKEQQRDVEDILPELSERHKASKIEGQVRLFKGYKGLRAIFQDILRTGKTNLLFGNEGQLEERMPAYQKQFVRQIKEKRIQVRGLIREDRATPTANPKNTRYVPKTVESPVVTNIYGDKIALVIWTDVPEGIIIENAAAAKAYRSYFEFMWQNAKQKK